MSSSALSRLPFLCFMSEIGSKIPLEETTICKAFCFLHKFCIVEKPENIDQYDLYTVCCACLNLASKLCDDPPATSCLRDVINLAYEKIHNSGSSNINNNDNSTNSSSGSSGRRPADLELNEDFYDVRDSVASIELQLLRVLKFTLNLGDSHKYLSHYLLSLKHWMPSGQEYHAGTLLVQVATTLHRDLYYTDAVITYEPQLIALAAIYVAMKLLDFELEGFKESCRQNNSLKKPEELNWQQTKTVKRHENWFNVFYPKATKTQLQTICEQFLDLVHLDNSNCFSHSVAKTAV